VPIDDNIKAARQIRLPWWGLICVTIASIFVAWVFDHLGRFDLTRPAVFSILVIVFAIAVKWRLRKRVWFWAAMVAIVISHIVFILYVPWTTRWIPVLVIMPICIVDLALIITVIRLLEKQFEKTGARGTGPVS
jgi:cell division protein FtsW (lipid II flippase)